MIIIVMTIAAPAAIPASGITGHFVPDEEGGGVGGDGRSGDVGDVFGSGSPVAI